MNIFDAVKDKVSIYDLLDDSGVSYSRRGQNEKIHCPFHGADTHKSAYIYADSDSIRCFTCNRSWDIFDFWAEANEWIKKDEKGQELLRKDGHKLLDSGRAAASLKDKFNVDVNETDWQKKLREFKKQPKRLPGFAGYELPERRAVAANVAHRLAEQVLRVPKERRAETWEQVRGIWTHYDLVNLNEDDWKDQLDDWKREAREVIGGLLPTD